MMVQYERGRVEAIAFSMKVEGGEVPFRLPCRWPAVEKILRKNGRAPRKKDSFENWARRISWRQILRWVQAQMALIETGMVKTEEVFLHCSLVQNQTGGQQTMFEYIQERKFLSLTHQEKPNAEDGQES